MSLDRRELLRLLAVLAASPGVLQGCGVGPEARALREFLAPAQRRWELYRRLGRRILEAGVVEHRGRGLAAALEQSLARDAEAPARDGDRAGEILLAAVRDDYSEGRLVAVDGWQLSVTEARVLALLAAVPAP